MLEKLMTSFIRTGRLTIIRPDGRVVCVGKLDETAPNLDIVLRLNDWVTLVKISLYPGLYFGEAYMDGTLLIEQGSLRDLLELCGRNLAHRGAWRHSRFVGVFLTIARYLQQYNSRRAARRNVAHHYNLAEPLFRAFLDIDLQYSCGYFWDRSISLDDAQSAKKRHILSKLLLEPEQRVLDIGSGWGGLAVSIAKTAAVHVRAITLSDEQLLLARKRAREVDVDHKISFELKDYREVEGFFDRIVSVGMFEHVGQPNYQVFFNKLASLLNDDGVALIHSIGRMDGPGLTHAWTRKYIFPGGYVPALSEVLPAIERAGLWLTDVEILRLHYAETLRVWRDNFVRNLTTISSLYDGRFCRMWEFYLAGSEMAFRFDGLMVFQIQLAKRVDTVPLIRDYMFDSEKTHQEPRTREFA